MDGRSVGRCPGCILLSESVVVAADESNGRKESMGTDMAPIVVLSLSLLY